MTRILTFGMLLIAAPAFAQSDDAPATATAPTHGSTIVYKCVNHDGSVVFSETPCAADPAKVQTIDTSGALRRGSGGNQYEIAAGVADSDCREQAFKSTHANAGQIEESKRHIAEYQQRLQELAQQPAYAAGGDNATENQGEAAPAPPDANRQAIDDLNASIAREQEFQQKAAAGDEQAYQNALHACDEQLRRNSQPPAEPAPASQPAPAQKDGGG